jgi:hypothetical protein
MSINRTCFRCDKQLEATYSEIHGVEDSIYITPDDATVWTSLGNYGSTVFDGGEFTGRRLELYICDECLKERAGMVYEHYRVNTEVENVKVFNPARH